MTAVYTKVARTSATIRAGLHSKGGKKARIGIGSKEQSSGGEKYNRKKGKGVIKFG